MAANVKIKAVCPDKPLVDKRLRKRWEVAMADDAAKIGQVEGGFFTPSGKLKSKEDLIRESKAKQASDAVTSGISSPKGVDSPLTPVRQRTYGDINSALNQNDEAHALVKEQADLVQKKIDIVQRLKAEPGDKKESQALKEQYAELEREQTGLTKRVEQYNRAAAQQGPQSIRVGNKNYGSFKQIKLETRERPVADLTSKEGLADALGVLREEKKALSRELKDINARRAEIKEVGSRALADIDAIEGRSSNRLAGIEQAGEIAVTTANAIRALGTGEVLNAFNPAQRGGVQALQQILSGLIS